MRTNILRLFMLILAGFLASGLFAEDKRIIPLDVNLIIDGSSVLKNSKNDMISWVNGQVVDRTLIDGDRITIWTAGDSARVIHSAVISGSAGKKDIKDKLQGLQMEAKTADFSGALKDAMSRISQISPARSRLSYTILITGSAEGLEPTVAGSGQGALRWFRSEKYERWQVLIVAPDIGGKVTQAASSYMASLR